MWLVVVFMKFLPVLVLLPRIQRVFNLEASVAGVKSISFIQYRNPSTTFSLSLSVPLSSEFLNIQFRSLTS